MVSVRYVLRCVRFGFVWVRLVSLVGLRSARALGMPLVWYALDSQTG